MKNLLLIIVILFACISCTDNVKFNDPAFEGRKDNVFWRAMTFSATVNMNDELTISAQNNDEKVVLLTDATTVKTYILGINNNVTATYTLTNGNNTITFSTGKDVGNGQIVITEYDKINKTISGTFKFKAENTDDNSLAAPSLNFQYGIFYKIHVDYSN